MLKKYESHLVVTIPMVTIPISMYIQEMLPKN